MIINASDAFCCLCVLQFALWGAAIKHLFRDIILYKPLRYFCLLGLIRYTSIDQRFVSFFFSVNLWARIFIFIFLFRYVRLVVHIVAYWSSKPYPIPKVPSYTSKDVTVIVPTVQPYGKDFEECIRSVTQNHPAEILVVTAGVENLEGALLIKAQHPEIQVSMVRWPNKRMQICEALPRVSHSTTSLVDRNCVQCRECRRGAESLMFVSLRCEPR